MQIIPAPKVFKQKIPIFEAVSKSLKLDFFRQEEILKNEILPHEFTIKKEPLNLMHRTIIEKFLPQIFRKNSAY